MGDGNVERLYFNQGVVPWKAELENLPHFLELAEQLSNVFIRYASPELQLAFSDTESVTSNRP